VSTIWRILTRRGFVTPQPRKRPRGSWQLDITHWPLAAGTGTEILNIIDDHSRPITASIAREVFKAADVVTAFRHAATRHGLPASMLSDIQAVFTGTPRGHGKVALEIELAALGIAFRHSRAYHRRPAARSSATTRPSRNGSPASPRPPTCPRCKPSSTGSPAPTTPAARTAP
jgi:hypothetical protein